MLTLIIIILIISALCRPRRYRGFGPHHHGPMFPPPMGGPRGPHSPMCGGPFDHGPHGPFGPGPHGPFGPGPGGHRDPGGPFGPGPGRW